MDQPGQAFRTSSHLPPASAPPPIALCVDAPHWRVPRRSDERACPCLRRTGRSAAEPGHQLWMITALGVYGLPDGNGGGARKPDPELSLRASRAPLCSRSPWPHRRSPAGTTPPRVLHPHPYRPPSPRPRPGGGTGHSRFDATGERREANSLINDLRARVLAMGRFVGGGKEEAGV